MCLLDPADVDAFERLDFINVPPEAVEHELRAGQLMPDRVLGDDELIGKPKPTNLDFEQRVDRLRDLVLKLAGAEDADPALRCQEDCKACGVPRFGTRPAAIKNTVTRRRKPEAPKGWV